MVVTVDKGRAVPSKVLSDQSSALGEVVPIRYLRVLAGTCRYLSVLRVLGCKIGCNFRYFSVQNQSRVDLSKVVSELVD